MNAEVGQQLSQSGQERRVAAVVDDMERDAHISVTHVALATHACHYLVWSGGVAEAGARQPCLLRGIYYPYLVNLVVKTACEQYGCLHEKHRG